MRVLVTGGAGFIGSNLVHALLTGGHAVGVIDDLSTGKAENLHPHAWFRTLDILDPAMPAAVAEFAPDAVVHLAAQASVVGVAARPRARLRGQRRGHPRRRPRRARGRRDPRHLGVVGGRVRRAGRGAAAAPRDRAEGAREPVRPLEARRRRAARRGAARHGRGLRVVPLRERLRPAPGRGGRGRRGRALLRARCTPAKPPTVFGTGAQTRDFIYVGDIVGAIVAALHAEAPLGPRPATRPPTTSRPAPRPASTTCSGRCARRSEYWGPVDYAARTRRRRRPQLAVARQGRARSSAGRPARASTTASPSRGGGSPAARERARATPPIDVVADKLRALHEARVEGRARRRRRARARERPRRAARRAAWPQIAAVKGLPGPAEASGGAAMSGADGDGARSRRSRRSATRPTPSSSRSRAPSRAWTASARPTGCGCSSSRSTRSVIVALDAEAAADIAEAFGCEPPVPGRRRCGCSAGGSSR